MNIDERTAAGLTTFAAMALITACGATVEMDDGGPESDAGAPLDASSVSDAGEVSDAGPGLDSGSPADSGAEDGGTDAGAADAGPLSCDATGLQAWYRFEETTGMVVDSSGCGNHGTAVGGARGVAGVAGNAFELSAASDHVHVDDAGRMNGFAQLTVEAWITKEDTNLGCIVTRGNGMGGDSFIFSTNPGGGNALSSSWSNTPTCTGMGTDSDDSGTTVPVDTWTHVAVTFDDAADEIIYYLDGVQIGSSTTVQGYCDTADGLHIGSINAAGGWPFIGTIDEMRIYNLVRTDEEICEDAGGIPLGGGACNLSGVAP